MPEQRSPSVCVRVCARMSRPPPTPPAPATSSAPPYLPETVLQFRELGQPLAHHGDNFLQGLRGGRPAGLCEPLEQRL